MSKKMIQYIFSYYVLYSIGKMYHSAMYWFYYYVLGDVRFVDKVSKMSLEEVEQIYWMLRNLAVIFQLTLIVGIFCVVFGWWNQIQRRGRRKEGQTVASYFGKSFYYVHHLQEKSLYTVYPEDELTHEKMQVFKK